MASQDKVMYSMNDLHLAGGSDILSNLNSPNYLNNHGQRITKELKQSEYNNILFK